MKSKTINRIISFLFLLAVLFSCKKDESASTPSTPFTATSGGVYISNEGVFNNGNSSITYYSPGGTTAPDAFRTANGTSLGDICQSMYLHNNKLYIVVNNSGKIEVCDPLSLKKTATITGLTSPRYFLPVSLTKAYVTDLFSGFISILNLQNNTVSGTISLSGWTEELIELNGMVYVANYISNKIFVIDPLTDLVMDSILAGPNGMSIQSDMNGKIWLLCSNDYVSQPGALFRIDPLTKQVEFNHTFTLSEYPARLRKNAAGTQLYLINSDVVKIDANTTTYPVSTFISNNSRNLYGLGVDPSGIIYVSDAFNNNQKGKIYRYDQNGNELNRFDAGISPGDFLFLP